MSAWQFHTNLTGCLGQVYRKTKRKTANTVLSIWAAQAEPSVDNRVHQQSQKVKVINQVQDPFRESRQEQQGTGPETGLEAMLQHASKVHPENRSGDKLQLRSEGHPGGRAGDRHTCDTAQGQEQGLGPELGGESTWADGHRVFGWRPRVRLTRATAIQWYAQGPDSFHASIFPLSCWLLPSLQPHYCLWFHLSCMDFAHVFCYTWTTFFSFSQM